MANHRYWKLGDLYAPGSSFNAVSFAEAYLRATVGGSNIVPVTFAQSSNAGAGYDAAKSYDGNAATLWGSAGGDNGGAYVAYDYGSAIAPPGALFMQARNDASPYYNQTPTSGNLYYSDTGLSGPWTFYKSISFSAWTSLGETQEQDLSGTTADIELQKAASLVVVRQPTTEVQVTKSAALVIARLPTTSIRVQNARALPVYRASPGIVAQKAMSLVVGLGRVANPRVSPWTFTIDAHDFLVIRTYAHTLIYDFLTGKWFTWGLGDTAVWPLQTGLNWNADLGEVMPDFGGITQTNVICGDDTFDTLYFLDPELADDMGYQGETGQTFRRVITGQIALRGHDFMSCPVVELTGSNGDDVVGSDLDVGLNISDDRGFTYWSAGTRTVVAGEHNVTLSWGGLGSFTGPGRLFRFVDNGAVYRVDGLDVIDGQ